MKKLIIIVLSILFFILPVQSKENIQIELEVSSHEIIVGNLFDFAIVLKYASTGNLNIGNFKIKGLENFVEVSNQKSTQIQMLNGATTAVTKITKKLKANKKGDFVIGPLEIIDKNISTKSNSIQINVKENKNIIVKDSLSKKNKFLNKDFFVNSLMVFLFFAMICILWRRKKDGNFLENNKDEEKRLKEKNGFKIPNIEDKDFFENVKNNLYSYIQNKYDFKTEFLTSREILENLKKKNVFEYNEINEIIAICNQAKFANNFQDKEKIIKLSNQINIV